ncbi:MAG: hypothetical protein JST84_13300 [Acidobacteria bacterium]|nr:hypothetical protein [Acidobacteriota bacterium]
MNNYDSIKTAILNKQNIIAYYKNLKREMCPHVLGTKKGREHGLFYQYGGESSSGAIIAGSDKNWRCIPIEGLTIVTICDGEWHTAYNHSKSNSCIDVIDVEVEF